MGICPLNPKEEKGGMLKVVVIPFDGGVQVRVRSIVGHSGGPCPGRSAAHSTCGAVRCRAGAVTNSGIWYGPGSAKRHEECRIASGTRPSRLHQSRARPAGRG